MSQKILCETLSPCHSFECLENTSSKHFDENSFEFVHKFESDGSFDEQIKSIIESTNASKIISYFSLKQYLLDNKQSYSNKLEKIYSQFEKDFPRQHMTLNNEIVIDSTVFIETLETLLSASYVPIYMKLLYPFSVLSCDHVYDISYTDLIILLCCQSSFLVPFHILNNIYDDINGLYFLVSGSGERQNTAINITINETSASISLDTIFFIKNTETNTIVKKISINVFIDFVFNEISQSDSQIAVFTWNIANV